ncbi:hypothetical protein GMRT_10562 [Giardia muris]|uniref:Uncharacterized protein n=1 Tax=Giardia muris TaxID=5742 RepID=A0A4Z1T2R0_GIAMU|nr:hypothetical protein GMRT_10562 [Giardia muris]|eukprot:TNJ26859.1 hypothetical protein GMRT_10562 [Giardia muris]
MGAGLCSAGRSEPRLPAGTASLLGPVEATDVLGAEECERASSLLEEGRMIATIMREIDTGRELYRVAVSEKTPAANVACFAQLSEVARLVLRYFAFRDAFTLLTLRLVDLAAEAALASTATATSAAAPSPVALAAALAEPPLLPAARLLVQLAHVCVAIDKQLLEKNLDSSVGLFRRMAANNLSAADPLNVLAMAKTITISLAGPAPTLHDLLEKAAAEADGDPAEAGEGGGEERRLERRAGYVQAALLLCLAELKQASTGHEQLRAFLVVSAGLLDALLTRLQCSRGVPPERANGIFAADCLVNVGGVSDCIGATRNDEMLFLRTCLQANAQKPADTRRKQDEARALLELRVL